MERTFAIRSYQLKQLSGLGLTFLAATFILGPLLMLAWKGLGQGMGEFLSRAAQVRLSLIMGQVFLLAVATTFLAMLFAIPLAWLLARTDLPGKDLYRFMAPLPLAIPPYIGAIVYQILLAPSIYTLWGAAWVLGLFTYPYIYLLVHAALERSNPSLEEAARSMGMGSWEVFRWVTLPLLRPALLGGGLMVFLYAWADFGVVSLLRMRTLTTVIYSYIQGTMDWTVPAGLALALSGITTLVLLIQLRVLGRAGYTQITGGAKPPSRIPLGPWRWPALFYVILVLTSSLFLPLGVLGFQASRLGLQGSFAFLSEQGACFLNSLWTAGSGASFAILVALVVAWLKERKRQAWGISGLFQIGYAIPGTVLGLGMVSFVHAFLPWLYATPFIVVIGYLVLYITPAFQAVKAAVSQLPVSLEEAARVLGRGPFKTFLEVTLPLIRPGLLGGWVLVFILSMRELAATLIVRPPGFDTLPVRVWIYTMDVGPEPRAALLALALVGTIALPWLVLILLKPKGVSLSW